MVTIPKITFLAALVIASCVTCIDPILSQAIAKGPFADKYVARPLREIISAEAGANEGFGFLFLALATYLIQYADIPGVGANAAASSSVADAGHAATHALMARADEVGRLGGGVAQALETWFVETWLYVFALSIAYGFIVGYGSCKAIKFALKQ
jgi:NhaP-type Na+/H+ or K+/H+ antiporter